MATEQQIQSKRIKQLEKEGYYVIKIIKANKNGLPDILALHPDKGALFCEVKTDKGVLSELQKFRLKELYEQGFNVEVLRGDRISSYPFESI
jgi:Holliday junction resolvase